MTKASVWRMGLAAVRGQLYGMGAFGIVEMPGFS
jgi:hypothetical protein